MYNLSIALPCNRDPYIPLNFLLKGKPTFILLVAALLGWSAVSTAQNITLKVKEAPLLEIFKQLHQQSGVEFVYDHKVLKESKPVSLNVVGQPLIKVLDLCFAHQPLAFEIISNTIVIKKKNKAALPEPPLRKPAASIVTGKVFDEKGQPAMGVTVKVKDSRIATATIKDGSYSIKIPEGKGTLVFSIVGYTTKEIAVTGNREVSVNLSIDAASLEDLIIIGYGSIQKRDLTAAVSTVASRDFLQGAVNSPLQLIDGKIAGVVISNPAAADPNSGTDVQVRGAASIEAGNVPLIVIDGMAGGNLRNITQQDIESITVLKDASSAAIYGSRGANGVILVTTKKGKAGNVTLTYDSYLEKDFIASKPDMLSADEFLAHGRDLDYKARTNWYDELIRENNFGQNHFLSLSGGNANSIFRISGNYRQKSAIDIASDRNEYGFRMNFLQRAMKGILEFSGNVSYRISNEKFTNYGAFRQAVKLNPTIPVMSPANPRKYNTLFGYETYNPVQDLLARENGADHTYTIVDFTIKLNILRNLNTELKLARQGRDRLSKEYYSSDAAESVMNNRRGRARLQDEKWADYTLEWLGNYVTRINSHDIRLTGGYSYQEFNNQGFRAENMNFPSDVFTYNNLDAGGWNLADGRLGMDSWKSREKTIAFLGRAIYNYDNTYFLTASFRHEGNTKFGSNNKWGFFPAVSAAWRLSKLPFIARSHLVDELKIRASYGVTGRSGFPPYTSVSRYSGYGRYQDDNGQWIQVYGPANNYNANLRWEKAISYNLGLDFSLLNTRLSGSVDVFTRKSTDLLSNYDVPVGSYVMEQIFVNVGNTNSKGIEVNINYDVVKKNKLKYTTTLTGSYIISKLGSWSNEQFQRAFRDLQALPSPGNPGEAYRLEDNVELGSFYGYKYAGVDESGKMLIWKDGVEGKEKIIASSEGNRDRDRVYIGHGTPHYEMAWGNKIAYNTLDLTLFFRGRFDYQILNLYQMYYGLQAEPGVNLLRDAYTRNGHITSGKVMTDYFLENGDYLKLENITLGWSPKINIKHVNSFRVYGTVKNVFTFTNYSGLDPTTVNVTGLTPGYGDLNVYPITRTVSIGAQLTF